METKLAVSLDKTLKMWEHLPAFAQIVDLGGTDSGQQENKNSLCINTNRFCVFVSLDFIFGLSTSFFFFTLAGLFTVSSGGEKSILFSQLIDRLVLGGCFGRLVASFTAIRQTHR